MTAIVGILNKSAVALAADSAETLLRPGGPKIYNHAHKLFNLSNHHPVGLMLYNSAELVGLPWETIIKMYRRHLGSQAFDTLPQYADHLISYLQSLVARFDPDDVSDSAGALVISSCQALLADLKEVLNTPANQQAAPLTDAEWPVFVNGIFRQLLQNLLAQFRQQPILPTFDNYDLSAFRKDYTQTVSPLIADYFANQGLPLEASTLDAVLDAVAEYNCRKITINPWTGVVVAGFGELDLFPRLVSYRLGPVLGNQLRYAVDRDEVKISASNKGAVAPYGQIDVIHTFLSGIDPTIRQALPGAVQAALTEFTAGLAPLLPDNGGTIAEEYLAKHQGIIVQKLQESLDNVSNTEHVTKLLDALATLPKEDVAELAESLINLTYLKRRASLGEESVGGPVDVAIITKGDGFIWLKRKLYFKPELNLSYVGTVLTRGGFQPTDTP